MINKHTRLIITQTLCDKHTMGKAIKIALVVGTLLNIINQGDDILHMMFERINFFKIGLTYFVPFFVSTYMAIDINMRLKIGEVAIISTNLTCKKCKSSLHVNKDSIIPKCPKCGIYGTWKATK